MPTQIWKWCLGISILANMLLVPPGTSKHEPSRAMLLEVVRNSWDAQRDETLVYLRVYSDGFAEAHPMRKVDFRNIQLQTKQLSDEAFVALRRILSDPATAQLQPEYSRSWGNKDFGMIT